MFLRPCRAAARRVRRSLDAVVLGVLAAGAVATAGNPALAQNAQVTDRVPEGNGDGMDMHLFRPTVDSKGFFSVNGADILGAGDISLGLVLDYGYRQLPLNEGHAADEMLLHAFAGTFQFDVGLANLLVLGVSAPVILSSADGADDIGPGPGSNYDDDKLDAQALGHIAAHAKLRLLRPDGDSPLGIALIAQAGYGIAESRNFGTEPGFFYWPQLALEKRFGDRGTFRLGLNGGFRGHTGANPVYGDGADGKPQLESGRLEYGNLVTSGVAASLRVLDPVELIAETYGTYLVGGSSDSDQRLSAEAIGGLKLFIERRSFLMMAGGAGYLPGFQSATARGVVGFVFEPSIGDRDGDGIKDDADDCPDDPEDYDGYQDTKLDSPPDKYGCPDPDNDNDGILDKQDRCPNNPEDRDGDEDEDGCPEASDGDRDGDGILDSRDKCPDNPEDRDGFEDQDGCPEPDNDQDGLPDVKDGCPNDPEDRDDFEDEDGCPDPDNDRDGIPDVAEGSDKDGNCMNRPEVYNGFEDDDGCPDKGKVILQDNQIVILEKIHFKTGSAEILPESFGIIEAVATTVNHHPEFAMIEVQGHADERSTDQYNLRLTQDRANAVVEALAKKGVDRKKIRAMGYGEYCPLDPGHDEPAWEKNRRVEFKIVRTAEGPTNIELGCDAAKQKGVVPLPP